jgi:ABC-type nitrate/sulfonate/bicarbonate transport system permease component
LALVNYRDCWLSFLSVAAFVAGPLTESVRGLPREWTIQRQRYRKGLRWEFLNVVVPGTLGPMAGPLRVALPVALTVAIAGDFMGSTVGIGRAVDSARVTFNTPAIFLLIIVSAVLGIGLDRTLTFCLRRVGHWVERTAKV